MTTPNNDISPFPSDVAKHAEALEKTMDSAMAELKDPKPIQPHDVLEAKLELLIKQSLQQQMKPLIQRLETTEHQLNTTNDKFNSLCTAHQNLTTKYDELKLNYNRIN